MIAVDTAADTTVTTATSRFATAVDVEFVVPVFVDKPGNVDEPVELTGIEARITAERRLKGMATTMMALAIVMKLRP
jgi:hypothetical protein